VDEALSLVKEAAELLKSCRKEAEEHKKDEIS